MKQHKVPYTGIPFQPKIEHRTIELQPFSFEERDKRRMAQKDMKIKSVLDEEKKVRCFVVLLVLSQLVHTCKVIALPCVFDMTPLLRR